MEDLTLPAAGQARIEAVDGGFQWLNFHMTDPLLAFGEVEFNIDASADGSGTITFFDQFGNDFANNVTLSGSGQNFFGARGINGQLISRVLSKRSDAHTSELQSLMRISYAVFCLKKKKNINN